MDYSPKLKEAMAEINAIIDKYDIAAYVILHTPGFTEYVNRISPSYSCAFLQDGQLRVRLKTAELPGGEAEAKKLAEGTYNMFTLMTDVMVMHVGGYIDLQEMLQEKWDGTYTDTNLPEPPKSSNSL